ncbi:uncharacterized protein Z520_10328 [Fonsecaea multimorphosa CBS 102226]|uniref:Protein rds1 n=1 Tax=Fonsecaea multimorphosa CBS 102226 TaxID=1442371 RepID=A0A0D2IA13_9EURO|nr:uncharacterized protein Z520_10328 [Fonsecaea multimorphosa CBS 102226]KIX93991.1 hypothetical protein Z520_10328 [Fonsecaea multimorphosa CBS 102226]OAL19338.1 hypothetical protein AYO22_09882 [Fonsecaea multimorphosa]
MAFSRFTPLAAVLAFGLAQCAPVPEPLLSELANTSYGPIPGQSSLYSTYSGTAAPFPGNITGAIVNTTSGPAGEDDLLFQNLLSAEWVIFSFYQQGVERFNSSAFVEAGFPNTTYERIQQIRDNEAGHLRIFQDQISTNSVKPGPCQYEYPYDDPASYIALQTVIEISSMAFLTGLELQAKLTLSKAALVAIAATESRHNTWSLIDNWRSTPFAGPADTVYPYANQILDFTNEWIVNGSCPAENPVYPTPRQNLPQMTPGSGSTGVTPGSTLVFNFTQPDNQPHFTPGKDYYAVFFHGVYNISVPFNTTTNSAVIPPQIEPLGIIVAVIADEEGAPTKENVLAGTMILPESPVALADSGY